MNYIKLEKDNMINGPGIRLVLWISGCEHKCIKCHNPETWDSQYGQLFTDKILEDLRSELSKSYYRGLTLTGGDPLASYNRKDLLNIVKFIKENFPDKDIWCWSGYTIEKLIPDFFNSGNTSSLEYELLSYIDVLVDGPFNYKQRELDLKDPNSSNILKYRGSSNQRIINVKETLKNRRIKENG